ncbi:MAG: PA0069 family radical SAM protein [Burkholderiaceae bacterium]
MASTELLRPAPVAVHGRGAVSNPQTRFDALRRHAEDDGWFSDDGDAPPLRTEVVEEQARSIITRNQSPDVPFDLAINPYRGCEHGCIYCFARPYHTYLGLSAGLDFETRLYAKVNAAERLRAELAASRYRCEPINLGAATDPYQPIERRYRITRQLIEVMAECRQPFTIVTKSSLIERDIDLLAPLARQGLVAVYLTLTTLDAELARRLEPRASAPWRRLQTVRRLHEAGIPVSVSMAPIIPFLNEPEIESLLTAARDAGAQGAFYTVLRLPLELRELFVDWLNAHYPQRAKRILARLTDMRSADGVERLNDARFFKRMRGEGGWAELIRLRFQMAQRKLQLDRQRDELRCDLFQPPPATPKAAADDRQLGLF